MSKVIKKQKKHVCLVKWRERVKDAIENGSFSLEDQHEAGNWTCCAVGEGREKLNKSLQKSEFKYYEGYVDAPKDYFLEKFGRNFYEAVRDDDFIKASNSLDSIEKRLNKLYVLV